MSAGQLNRILIEDKENFHEEKTSILQAGLSVADYIQVDDTGARHKGVNGYYTFLGNKLFSWFASTSNKSRINFLELLRAGQSDYQLTDESFAYMERYKVAPWIHKKFKTASEKIFADKFSWEEHLSRVGITHKHYRRIVTEAALIGSILSHGFSIDTVILSDDAGQFNVFLHALYWIHAERGIKSLIPQTLNLVLQRLFDNKNELLLVLERPEIPLHNNLSEGDIREYVKRRKISGSTRSDEGRRC